MGNTPAKIIVKLDAQAFYPGTMLSGRVFVQVNNDSVQARSLDITIRGYESTSAVFRTTSNRGSANGHRTHTQKNTVYEKDFFLRTTLSLALFPDGKVNKGNYEFPFQMKLPLGLFSTIARSPAQGDPHFQVAYDAYALLHSGSTGWFSSEEKCIEGSQNFVVFSGLSHIPYSPSMIDPQYFPISTCCCSNGMVLGSMYSATTFMIPGETYDLGFYLQNNSTRKVKKFQISFKEVVSWYARGHNHGFTTDLVSTDLCADPGNNLTGIDDALLAPKEEPLAMSNEDLLKCRDNLLSGKSKFRFKVPEFVKSDMKGQLITIRHRLFVTVVFAGCTQDLVLAMPITVVNKFVEPQMQGSQVIYPAAYANMASDLARQTKTDSLPTDWSATVAPVATLEYKYAPRVSDNNEIAPPAAGGQLPNALVLQPDTPYTANTPAGALCASLRMSFTPVVDTESWMAQMIGAGMLNLGIHDEEYVHIFKTIKQSWDQVEVAERLAGGLKSISVAALCSIADGADDFIQDQVLEKFLSKVPLTGKEHAKMLQTKLSNFQYLVLESKYFK